MNLFPQSYTTKTEFKKGFTLIELLVVISIIALLSSVVLASLQTARQKGQEAAVRSYLKQVVTALELYRNDHGSYPSGSGTVYLNDLIQGPLGNYIQHQSPPYATSYSNDGAMTYRYSTTSYSCGSPQSSFTIEPYVIWWISSKTLDLPLLWNSAGTATYSRHHCVSLISS